MSAQTESDTQIPSRWLAWARLAWFLVAGLGIGLDLLGVPLHWVQWQTVCSGASCPTGQLTPQQIQELQQLGLSLPSWAASLTAYWLLPPLVSLLVAAVIFWRKSDDRMAFFASFTLIAFELSSSADLTGISPIVQFLSLFYQALGSVCLGIFVLVFPDGHFVPRWTRWLALLLVCMGATAVLFPDTASMISNLFNFALPLAALLQIYRYRRVANAVQRQQIKWVVYAIVLTLIILGGGSLLFTLFYPLNIASALAELIAFTAITLCLVLVPLAFGIAILRWHLWDIDVIIRRTLLYSTLSLMLALVYFGSVVVLQQLFRALAGQQSEAAILLSTLGMAALFNPLRHRIQRIIDRRFYRRKYDAARTLAEFGVSLRNEVDLRRLSEHLLTVVEETMQPAHVSLWLRPPGRERTPATDQ